jgi:FixJ family two-component response regulator
MPFCRIITATLNQISLRKKWTPGAQVRNHWMMAILQPISVPASLLATGIEHGLPGVLVVDGDSDCVAEYCSLLTNLGRSYRSAGSCEEALSIIANDPSIGIVLTEIRMSGMSGITFLGEIRARFDRRPIVAIVVTGYPSMEVAVSSMRHDAVDFLSKPVRHAEYVAALDRASRHWAIRKETKIHSHILNLAREVSRILALMDFQIPKAEAYQPDSLFSRPVAADSNSDTRRTFIGSILGARRDRRKFFPSNLFADPAWDIILELAAAQLDGRKVSVSEACIAAEVPTTTALRYVRAMTAAGHLIRESDLDDQRRVNVRLSNEMIDLMTLYLQNLTMASA